MCRPFLHEKSDIEEYLSEDIYFSTWPQHPKQIWIEGNASLSFGLKISKKLQNSFITVIANDKYKNKIYDNNYKFIKNISILENSIKDRIDNYSCDLYIYIEAILSVGGDYFVDYLIDRNQYNLYRGSVCIIDKQELITSNRIVNNLEDIRMESDITGINASYINDTEWGLIMINFDN